MSQPAAQRPSAPGDPRRGADRAEAILAAAFTLLGEIGYDALTMDRVALRARSSKATIYRHWPGKPELVAAALRRFIGPASLDIPETDSLRGDLLATLRALRQRFLAGDRGLFTGLIRAMQDDPVLAGIMRAQIAANKAAVGTLIAGRAERRGEPVPDLRLIQEIGPAHLIVRILITGEPVDEDYLTSLVDRVVLPLLTPTLGQSTGD